MPQVHSLSLVLLALASAQAPARSQDLQIQVPHVDGAARTLKGSDATALTARLVENQLLAIPGVRSVHDLHVCTVTSGIDFVGAHVVVGDMAEATRVLKQVQQVMAAKFDTRRVTVQVETESLKGDEKLRGI